MAKEGQTGRTGLEGIAGAVENGRPAKGRRRSTCGIRAYCGEIDMRIAADGTWFYQKTPIGRPALVKLFASILKREGDRYFLVTPVEKCGIVVDDAPFLAVELRIDRQHGDTAGSAVPHQCGRLGRRAGRTIRCGSSPRPATGGLKPYLHVRRDLWAKVTRALFYRSRRARRGARHRRHARCSESRRPANSIAMAPADEPRRTSPDDGCRCRSDADPDAPVRRTGANSSIGRAGGSRSTCRPRYATSTAPAVRGDLDLDPEAWKKRRRRRRRSRPRC